MELISLGKIIESHGLNGGFKIWSTTNFGKERYKLGNHLLLVSPDDKSIKEIVVKSYSNSGNIDYVSFDEITNPEDANMYKGYFIKVNKEDAKLPEGSYFFSDLEKCEIIDENGIKIGKVKKVEEFPAQVTLRCLANGKEFFIPYVPAFILKVNMDEKTIMVKIIEGML